MAERLLPMHDVVRYGRSGNLTDVEVDGFTNFYWVTRPPFAARNLQLESGINPAAPIRAVDGERRPVILLRSSPHTSGRESNPWEDVYDLDHGHARYYGDHKATTVGPVGVTPGNRALLQALDLYGSPKREDRLNAPPLLVFRSTAVVTPSGKRTNQGHLEFCGAAIIERLEMIIQREAKGTRTFPNLVLDLVITDLVDREDAIDFRWIDDRRNPDLTAEEALRFAPKAWKKWVNQGRQALPSVRRRVLSSRVKSAAEQRPEVGSREEAVLQEVYAHFHGRKHRFEALAASVAAQVFQQNGGRYSAGWLTSMGGDGGMDFVGRLDAGSTETNTPLVVLGQAKCVLPSTNTSAEAVARVVARLRRGWIGIFVTTGAFSEQAQIEVIDDSYPVVLVNGLDLAREVIKMAEESFEGDVLALLDATVDSYDGLVTSRRPEEILRQA